MKIKIREAYLLILIVLGLVSLSVYSTYALFTKEVTIDNVVSFNTSISLSDSNLVEYELVTLGANETKIIELVVSNSSTSTLYYGCWYETLSSNSNITIGMYLEKSNVSSTGTITSNEVKTLVVGIVNNSTSTTLVNLGVVGSTTENLGLSTNRNIITDTFTPEIIVTDEYLESHTTTTLEPITPIELGVSGNYDYSKEVSLVPGTYTLEVWGAQGGSAADIGESGGTGGKGGYSKGDITLLETTTLYLKKGGASYFNDTIPSDVGGFNGGGDSCLYDAFNSGGGGASDIRIGTDSLYARVIVAGGGGGSMGSTDGGVGGGTTGSGISPGTQSGSTGGSFGSGFSCSSTDDAGGGGGWYGGGANSGGSGYVYTASTASNYPSGCLLNSTYYLTNAETYSGNQTFTDFNGSTVTGHSGEGSVRVSGMGETLGYSIPVIYNLTNLITRNDIFISLTDNITYQCEAGKSDCTYLGPDIVDTSTLENGTHIINYKIKTSNNITYIYQRTVTIVDEVPANAPALTDALIPVSYDESTSTWVKADASNSDSSWYNYSEKKWANAVLVSSTNRSTYKSASAGTTIADTDILAFYVWIPRYKYKVWNKDKIIGTDSYNAYNTGIDVVFEEDTASTGTISCTYSYEAPSSTAGSPNETCTGSNGDYYTHPAFTFGDQELTGFWMGKFELSSDTPDSGEVGNGTSAKILPNVNSWKSKNYGDFWKIIYDMQISNNIYGLSTSRTNTDSHLITNMEWGAVAYLTNSKYGRCTNGSCTEVSLNAYGVKLDSTTKTGCGPISSGSTSNGKTCNAYNTTLGQTASTTGNIYGVYDMSGGAYEYVMGNMSKSNGTTFTYNVVWAGTNFTYSADTAKYLTPYAYGTTENDQQAYNRGRLGDATSEVMLSGSSWYKSYLGFVCAGSYTDSGWFYRGGGFSSGVNAGLFGFESTNGGSSGSDSTRAALAIY